MGSVHILSLVTSFVQMGMTEVMRSSEPLMLTSFKQTLESEGHYVSAQ